MPLFNVMTPVVALIEADTAQDAIRQHDQALTALDLQTHPGADAFESEPQ